MNVQRPYFDTGCPADVSLFRRRQHHGRVWETCEDRAGIQPSSVAAPPATERVTKRHGARWEGFIKVDTRQEAGRFEPCSVHQ
jgi:hypothetical protein